MSDRRVLVFLLSLLIAMVPGVNGALANDGTNMHEKVSTTPIYSPNSPAQGFDACGHGRYWDPRAHRCHGPGDVGTCLCFR